jgi:hypothetical protein
LHKASLMATTVSAYAMSNDGALPSTITDFGNSGYDTDLTDNGTQFKLTVAGIGFDVCTQMKNVKGGMVRDVTCDETSGDATITYYKNLATTETEGEKSPTGGKFDPACKNVRCDDGLKCFHGECKCPNGVFMCGDQCCAEGTYCARGANTSTYACTEPSVEDGECTQNSDCKDAEGNVDTSKYCNFSGGSCTGPTGGTCTDKGVLDELKDTDDFAVKTLNLPSGNLTGYKTLKKQMNWWSASNLCQAHGKQMVTMADLGLADSGTNTYCYFDKTQSSYATYPCICNGGSDSDCSVTNTAIRGALGTSGYFWLADNSKLNSCAVRLVYLSFGYIVNGNRTSGRGRGYALCR